MSNTILKREIANMNSPRTVSKNITFNTWLNSHFAKVLLSEEVGQGSDQNAVVALCSSTTMHLNNDNTYY